LYGSASVQMTRMTGELILKVGYTVKEEIESGKAYI
jgi:hypothetical protein